MSVQWSRETDCFQQSQLSGAFPSFYLTMQTDPFPKHCTYRDSGYQSVLKIIIIFNTPSWNWGLCSFLQKQCWNICHYREPLFAQCGGVVSVEKYISRCIETACSCLQATKSTEAGCRCQALLGFVTQCTAADPSVDLSSWRVQHDCRKCTDIHPTASLFS